MFGSLPGSTWEFTLNDGFRRDKARLKIKQAWRASTHPTALIWTRPTRDDLKQIHDFIKKDSAFYAKKILFDILASSDSLTKFRYLNRAVAEMGNERIRETPIHAYH